MERDGIFLNTSLLVLIKKGKVVSRERLVRDTMENTGNIRWQSNMHFTSVDYVRAGFLIKKKGKTSLPHVYYPFVTSSSF